MISIQHHKIIAIHQPNFFPWLGYFSKIKQADAFVFLDNVDISLHNTQRHYASNKNKLFWKTNVAFCSNGKTETKKIQFLKIREMNHGEKNKHKLLHRLIQMLRFLMKYFQYLRNG
jgi:hypothetical protein